MADSEDEYDRRSSGRDKFRRERNDYTERNSRNRRDDWQESRESGGSGVSWNNQNRDRIPQRRDYRDNYSNIGGSGGAGGGVGGQRRDRYSPADRSDMSPPMKRVRGGRDWEDRSPYPNYEMGGYGMSHNPNNNWNPLDNNGPNQSQQNQNQHRDNESGLTQPPMMTFKQYLATQDDGIDDQIAVKKYNEYKLDFKKKQINDFFTAHKDEEWFRSKYHPEEYESRKAEQTASLKNRLRIFMELFSNNWIDSVSVDVEKANQIIRLLDAAVIKLEGGSDFDLKALDENFEEEKAKEPDLSLFSVDVEKPRKVSEWKTSTNEKIEAENGDESLDSGMIKDNDNEVADHENDAKEDNNEEKETNEKDNEVDESRKSETVNAVDSLETMEEGEASMDENSESKVTIEEQPETDEMIKLEREDSPNKSTKSSADKPRALHKTASIFLRNLAPTITKQEIEDLCKNYEGFLRVAIAEPQTERRFYRRGWATYERHVNIREICWSLNSTKLRDCELGAIVNRDLSRRIRSVNGIASHKNVVRADIRHAAKIVFNLDQQKKLWDEENNEVKEQTEAKPMFGFASKNPLLKNITDYLIEEASAEEEELLGTTEIGELDEGEDSENNGPSLDRDENLIKVLDRLLLYLRIVHSIDYYNHSDYPNEDEMPNRIGIMHARGMVSTSSRVTQQEINDYIKSFETKVQPFLQPLAVVTEEEAKKLGLKDAEEEAENFIKQNTQELAKDKWLCPLSGKKFKGPDFVRKHIVNKHIERVEEAKKNAEYLNNYIYDPKRPQLPEHPSNRQQTNTPNRNEAANMGLGGGVVPFMPTGPAPYHGPPPYMQAGYGPRGPPMGAFGAPMMGYGPGRYPPMGMGPMHDYGRGPMGHAGKPRFTRKRINYRDLDAPNDDHDNNN